MGEQYLTNIILKYLHMIQLADRNQ